MIENLAYPLSWPPGWTRTPAHQRKPSRFSYQADDGFRSDISMTEARRRLAVGLRLLNAKDTVISTNIELRRDGFPRRDRTMPGDVGVAIYFTLKNKDRVLACDRWSSIAGNIAAIAAHIEAIRAVDRYGVGSLDQAFAGYAALPAPGHHAERKWWQVLEIDQRSPLVNAEAAYRSLAREHHPDSGGSHAMMAELNAAIAQARKELS